jgi:hypothetical protein
MMFSHVGERWESWPAAAIWLLIVGAFRIRTAEGRDVKLPIGMSAFACAALSLVILSWPTPGDLRTSPGVELKDGIVWMGADADRQRAWTGMVVDTKVVGEWYGQQIRTHPAKHPVAIVWARIFSIEADNLLLTGDVASSIDIGRVEAKEIFWINPPPQVPPFLRSTPTTVFWGGRRFGSSVEWRSFASRRASFSAGSGKVSLTKLQILDHSPAAIKAAISKGQYETRLSLLTFSFHHYNSHRRGYCLSAVRAIEPIWSGKGGTSSETRPVACAKGGRQVA